MKETITTLDIFGKFEEYEEDRSIESGMFQLSEYSLYNEDDGKVYITDDLGRTLALSFTNGGYIINDLMKHKQYDTVTDVLDMLISADLVAPGEN